MATVRKRRGRWFVRYKGADGASHELAMPKGALKAEAERFRIDISLRELRIQEGLQARPSTEALVRAAARYLEAIRGHRSWASIESRWRLHILPALGKVPHQQLRPTQIEALLASLRKDGYSQQQCRHVRTTLSAFYSWMRKDAAVDVNPVDRVEAIPVPKGKPKALALEQVLAVADAATFPGLRYLVLLAYYSGARPGELLALRKPDVVLTPPAHFRIERTLGSATTKTGKGRVAYLPRAAVALLQDLMHTVPREHLFLNAAGQPMKPRQVARAFKTAVKRAGLVSHWEAVCRRNGCGFKAPRKPEDGERCACGFLLFAKAYPMNLSPKDLRSSSATRLASRLPDGLRVAQHHLGHGSLRTTEGSYVAPPEANPQAEAVERAFAPDEPRRPHPVTH